MLEHPQLHKLQLCKELKIPPCSWRSNNYSADGRDALKLYEWIMGGFFFSHWRFANTSDGDTAERNARFRFHSASGQFWNPEVFLLCALRLRLIHIDSHTHWFTGYDCWILSLNSIYSHFHFLPSSNVYKLWEDFQATSVPETTFQVNLLRATSLALGQLISKGILNGVSICIFLCCGLYYTQGTLCCHCKLSSKVSFLREKGSNYECQYCNLNMGMTFNFEMKSGDRMNWKDAWLRNVIEKIYNDSTRSVLKLPFF